MGWVAIRAFFFDLFSFLFIRLHYSFLHFLHILLAPLTRLSPHFVHFFHCLVLFFSCVCLPILVGIAILFSFFLFFVFLCPKSNPSLPLSHSSFPLSHPSHTSHPVGYLCTSPLLVPLSLPPPPGLRNIRHIYIFHPFHPTDVRPSPYMQSTLTSSITPSASLIHEFRFSPSLSLTFLIFLLFLFYFSL